MKKGQTEAELSRNDEAVISFTESIAIYNKILQIAPNNITVLINRGLSMALCGNLKQLKGEIEEACLNWTNAVESFSQVLFIVPNEQILTAKQEVEDLIKEHCQNAG